MLVVASINMVDDEIDWSERERFCFYEDDLRALLYYDRLWCNQVDCASDQLTTNRCKAMNGILFSSTAYEVDV